MLELVEQKATPSVTNRRESERGDMIHYKRFYLSYLKICRSMKALP